MEGGREEDRKGRGREFINCFLGARRKRAVPVTCVALFIAHDTLI